MKVFFLALIASAIAAPLQETDDATIKTYLPVPQYEFSTPSTALRAKYIHPVADTKFELVDFTIETTIPALNLGNLKNLAGIECDESQVVLTFEGAVQQFSNQELLLLINPGKCIDSSVISYRKSNQITVKDNNSIVFVTEKVEIKEFVLSIDVASSQIVQTGENRKEYETGLEFNWNPPAELMIAQLSTEHNMKAMCSNCFLNGNVYLRINITKSTPLPSIQVDLTGYLDSQVDLMIQADARNVLTESSAALYQYKFLNLNFPGLISISPSFILDFGVIIPAGPGAKMATGFEFVIPAFQTRLIGGSSTHESTQSGFKPRFKTYPLTITPGLKGDQIFKAGVTLTPKIMLEMILADDIPYTIGIGVNNMVEASVRTGYYAQPKCSDGQVGLKTDASSHIMAFIGGKKQPLKPWFGKTLIDQCRNA